MNQDCVLYGHDALRRVTGPAVRPGGLEITQRALNLMNLSSGSRVLDVGSGAGATLSFLAGRGLNAAGVDATYEMIRGSAADTAVAVAEALPFSDCLFDAVFCECMLSLVSDASAALYEMHRVLAPGGMIAVSDLFARGTVPKPQALAGVRSCLAGMVDIDSAVRRIGAAGFKIVQVEDHSRELKELAARIIFEHGDLNAFWAEMLGCDGARCVADHVRAARPGYYLVLARGK